MSVFCRDNVRKFVRVSLLCHQKEEWLNAATHGCGLLLAVAASFWMVTRLQQLPSWPAAVGTACIVYCLSLLGLYLASTLSHVFTQGHWHDRFRRLDQAFIYPLILGTYSPLAAMFFQSTTAWVLFAAMWALAIIGFVSKAWFSYRVEQVSIAIYLILGWAPALIGFPLGDEAVKSELYWMIAGGGVYCAGIVFLLLDKRVWFFHGIWHLFVLGGSAIHFYTIARLIFGA